MLCTILLVLFGSPIVFLLYLIIKPMIELILLKLKHGKDIEIQFMPILGETFFQKKGLKQYRDSLYFKRNILKEKSSVKVIAWNFFLDQIVLTFVEPKLIKEVISTPEMFRKNNILLFSDQLTGKGLIFTEDQHWKDQRKMIGHQFTFENLKCRLPIIKDITKKYFLQFIETEKDIKLLDLTAKITGSVVSQTFFGQEFSEKLINGQSLTDTAVECVAIQAELSFNRLWIHLRGTFFGYTSQIPKYLLTSEEKQFWTKLVSFKNFLQQGMIKREESFVQNEIEQNKDFIQIYLAEFRKNNRQIDMEELVQQFITFAFAGTDTTSILTTMAFYILSLKPDLQEDLRIHINKYIKSFDDFNQQDLAYMDKLNAFIMEVLRVYPPVPTLLYREARQIHKIGDGFINIQGNFTVKPSYLIAVGILSVQQNPQYFDKPDEFNINRWLNNDLKEPHAFLAFSAGSRNCIGQHMAQIECKVMLIYVLLNYKLVPDLNRVLEMQLPLLYMPADDRLVHFQSL